MSAPVEHFFNVKLNSSFGLLLGCASVLTSTRNCFDITYLSVAHENAWTCTNTTCKGLNTPTATSCSKCKAEAPAGGVSLALDCCHISDNDVSLRCRMDHHPKHFGKGRCCQRMERHVRFLSLLASQSYTCCEDPSVIIRRGDVIDSVETQDNKVVRYHCLSYSSHTLFPCR